VSFGFDDDIAIIFYCVMHCLYYALLVYATSIVDAVCQNGQIYHQTFLEVGTHIFYTVFTKISRFCFLV